jgi:hypothetical protein
MKREEDLDTQTSERRRTRRLSARGHVKLHVLTHELEGPCENVSQTGVLFFSEGDLRVSVDITEGGATRKVEGRLVRAQRMRGDHFGWAIEFDPS